MAAVVSQFPGSDLKPVPATLKAIYGPLSKSAGMTRTDGVNWFQAANWFDFHRITLATVRKLQQPQLDLQRKLSGNTRAELAPTRNTIRATARQQCQPQVGLKKTRESDPRCWLEGPQRLWLYDMHGKRLGVVP